MISSKKKTGKKSAKPQKARCRTTTRQPDWDPTISDLSGLKLSKEEQAKRHAAFVSKNRVQVSDSIRSCEGQIASAQSASSPVWQDFLNYGTVAQELQATRSQAQPQPLHDMPTAGGQTVTQNERGEAAGPTADCEAAPAGGTPQADRQLPSPASSTSDQAATDNSESSPQASQSQKQQPVSPPVGRHRANAAVTAAPAKLSTSAQAGTPSQAQGASDIQQLPQLLSDTQQLLRSNTSDLGQKPGNTDAMSLSSEDQGATLKGSAMFTGQKPAATEARSQAERDLTFQKMFELETKLSEVTHRLSAAEQARVKKPAMSTGQIQAAKEAGSQAEQDPAFRRASELETKLSNSSNRLSAADQVAGPSSEICDQLLQLKADKAALQADMKQFMQHTSSMLTTLQAQMSRLMGCSLPSTAPVSAENSCISAASGQLDEGRPESPLAEGQGRSEPISPVTSAPARGSIHDWHLESHGSQPSPLARHEIFQSATPSPKHTLQQAGHPKPTACGREQPGQLGISMDELRMGLGKRTMRTGPADRSGVLPSPHTTAGRADTSRHSFSASEAQQGAQGLGSMQDRLGPLTDDAPVDGSVYADEAALPSFAQMAAAQGCLERPQHGAAGMLPRNRQSAAPQAPGFTSRHTSELEPSPLPQRLTEMYRDPGLGREALREVPMPQLRQKGLPHAPLPKAGSYNGPAALRLKPMSTGLPPMQPVVNVHDSLALSTWAAAGRRSHATE